MKKLYLINNPVVFQGEKYLGINKNYFEGWYFKNTNDRGSIAFIPGISISEDEKKSFIQIITDNESYFINYDINDFKFSYDPFYVEIGNSFFSLDYIHIDIVDEDINLVIYGDINYSNSSNINVNWFSPNIMGPFSYIPFMECNHAILSMSSIIDGFVNINNKKINFNKDIGYVEKDWGCSFPKTYIWGQGNKFKKHDAAFMISIADIPFKIFNFRGFICSLIVDNKEYRFATYNNSKLVKYEIDNNSINIILKKGSYSLIVKSKYDNQFKLIAPVNGKMEKDIFESISASIDITLKKKNVIIFSDTSVNCGLEIVN